MSNPNYQAPFKRVGLDANESTVAEDVPATSMDQLLDNTLNAKFSNRLMHRVHETFLFERPVLVADAPNANPNLPAVSPMPTEADGNNDYEFRLLDSIVAQDMVGFDRNVPTWDYPIRNIYPGLTQARGMYAEQGRDRSAIHQGPAGSEYRDLARYFMLGSANEDTYVAQTAYSFPIGPVTEKTYVQMNPKTNCAVSAMQPEGTPPLWMKLEDIRAPDGTFQHVSVKFTIETDCCVQIYDDTNCPANLGYFTPGGVDFQPNAYNKGHDRWTGSAFCVGPEVHTWSGAIAGTPRAIGNAMWGNGPEFTGTGINGVKQDNIYIQNNGVQTQTKYLNKQK